MKRISYFSKTRKFVGNIMKEQSSLNKNREEVSNVMPPSPLIISCNTSRYFIGQRNYRSWNLPKPVGWLCWSPKTCGEATPPRRSSILRGGYAPPQDGYANPAVAYLGDRDFVPDGSANPLVLPHSTKSWFDKSQKCPPSLTY